MDDEVSFIRSVEDDLLVCDITARAQRLYLANGIIRDPVEIEMDVVATHANGCPLRLRDLLDADDFNFMHDICGIERHINRFTGKLERCFLPRFADCH